MSGRPPHSVLLRVPERYNPHVVAEVLARHRGLQEEELFPSVRAAWGLPAESLPAEEAEALAAALTAEGQEATAVPAALIEALPDPVPVTKAELAGDGLDVVAAKEAEPRRRLLWNHLRAICAGEIEIRATKTETTGPSVLEKAVRLGVTLTTGIPVGRGREVEASREEIRRRRVVDLLFLDPARRVRIFADEFDYSILGPAMTYSAESNFPLLVARLKDGAPRARRGRGTRAFLGDGAISAIRYASLEDLAREERWLSALVTLDAK